ncbi:cell division cycle protein 27 homolog B-like [Rutidosis leptorrhynchoides]|uniref:cell division cycle protein 27 homolog B-like n=1 Tax=Rutidosis leptorrhynchoides TaxID=125765 RepID=UPI003A99354F
MEGVLIDCVQNSLKHLLYRNAIFMCERLCSEFPSEANLQLLATCYLQSNQAYSAYHILKGTQMPLSRYLFALSCFQMDLLNEAEMALCPSNEPNAEVPNGAAGHYLLGLIYRCTNKLKSAADHFNQALSVDPLLWAAYEELCKLGAAGEAISVFGDSAFVCIQKQYTSHDVGPMLQASTDDHNLVPGRQVAENVSPRQLRHLHGNNAKDNSLNHNNGSVFSANQANNNGVHANLSFYTTPSPMATQLSGVGPPPLICRNMLPNGPSSISTSADASPRSTVKTTIQAPRRKFVDEGKLRKISGRLFSDSGPRRSTRLAGEMGSVTNSTSNNVTVNGTNNSSKYPTSKLGSAAYRSVTVRKGPSLSTENLHESQNRSELDDVRSNTTTTSGSSPSPDTRSCERDGSMMPMVRAPLSVSKVATGASEVLSLLKILGEGYRLSCLYRCKEALDVFLQLPYKHYNTGWVLSQVGKAHFELVDYLEAERAFCNARLATPYSLEGMDIYSTVLYHLKEDMRLSYLAQELISTDRLAPQSWCAIGNCYSLQKDHETALKNFQRAVQLNSRFAYAHTLCGHEYVALEDFENGIRSYQNALQIDERHYNAWYGLAMIYLRQEKYQFSEHHFRRALQINPRSSVIMCYLGTSLHALKRNEEALAMMEKAIIADKMNPLPMYQKANILVSLEDFDGALQVLEDLKEFAPRESSVYALMGKIYKRRSMYDKAMLHFGLALDLKPSATDVATIKAAIEKLIVPDELDDSS